MFSDSQNPLDVRNPKTSNLLTALVPAPDNISLDKLHPSMSWESTFGPQCIMKREIIQKAFDKRQRAVGMLKAAALDAHRKKLTMARKLGLDVKDEELTGAGFGVCVKGFVFWVSGFGFRV